MPATVRNVAREKLEKGNLSLGVGIRMTRSVEIAKAMAVSGFDWLFLDMEHGVMSLEACAQTIATTQVTPSVLDVLRAASASLSLPSRLILHADADKQFPSRADNYSGTDESVHYDYCQDGIRTDLTKDLKLSPEDLEKIRWKNACNLLHIDPAKLGQANKLAAE